MKFEDTLWGAGKICLFAMIVPSMAELKGGPFTGVFLGCACAVSYLEVLVRYLNAGRSDESRVNSFAGLFKPDVPLRPVLLLLSPYFVALVAANVYSFTDVRVIKWACVVVPFLLYVYTVQSVTIQAPPDLDGKSGTR